MVLPTKQAEKQPEKQAEEQTELSTLIASLRAAVGVLNKQDIQAAAQAIGQTVTGKDNAQIRLGDDCAAIPDGDGYLLFASEGIWPQLVEQDPWFAGWCAVMVNLSDIAAMGGEAIAVVDALWSKSVENSQMLWAGMQAASQAYGVPIVGGHTNCHSPYEGLAVSVMGRSQQLITSFDAQPGDALVMVVNMAGAYHGEYAFWNAATTAEPEQLQNQLAQLPLLAASGLCHTGKDISMGGLAGTLLMLCEASGCGALLDLERVPRPAGTALQKWLTSFPSFGFLLSVAPENVEAVTALFSPHGLTCQAIGEVRAGNQVIFQQFDDQKIAEQQLFWDLAVPLTGFGAAGLTAEKEAAKATARAAEIDGSSHS